MFCPTLAPLCKRYVQDSDHADVLKDLPQLYRHLSTKGAKEKAMIQIVWEEFD
jgi:hypothetical protein